MKKNKIYIIVLLIIIFLLFDIFVHLNINENVIYIGNTTKVIVKDEKITINNKNTNLKLMKSKIYFNKEFIDGYIKSSKSKMNNGVTIYDAYNLNGQLLRFNDDLIAYTGKNNIKIADCNSSDFISTEDDKYIADFLLSEFGNGISLDVPLSYDYYKKIIYDIDNDGDDEYIYSLDIIESGVSDYSYVFIVDDEEKILVSRKKGDIKDSNLPRVFFFNLIDFNNDNNYEIVLRYKNGEYGKNIYKIYNYNGEISEIK